MTLQQILYALTIAECGSMNKASEKLFIVQPTLTSAIQELENEVGLTIFLRTRKGVIPTPEGAEFLDDIRNFYRHYNMVMQKYEGEGDYKRKFGVSPQQYSFAVKAFTEMAKKYDMKEFDFAIRETQTKMVLTDVGSLKSEIGVLDGRAFEGGGSGAMTECSLSWAFGLLLRLKSSTLVTAGKQRRSSPQPSFQ